jgi:hypothetical protein
MLTQLCTSAYFFSTLSDYTTLKAKFRPLGKHCSPLRRSTTSETAKIELCEITKLHVCALCNVLYVRVCPLKRQYM